MNSLGKVHTSLFIILTFCLFLNATPALSQDLDEINILMDDPELIQKTLSNTNFSQTQSQLRDLDFSFELISWAEYDPYDYSAVWYPTEGCRGLCAGSDLDGDGHEEIFAVHYGNGSGVVGFEMNDSGVLEMIWNSSTTEPASYNLGTRFVQTGDMDGDGLGEIIFFRGRYSDDPNRGLYIYEWDGSDNGYWLAYHNTLQSLSGDLVYDMVIEHFLIADVDDDGSQELIFANNGLTMGIDRSEDFFSILSIAGDIGSGEEVLTEEYWISPRDVDRDGVIDDLLGGGSGLNVQVCDTDNDGLKEVFCHAWNYFNIFFFECTGPDSYTLGDTSNIRFTYPDDDSQLMNAAVSDMDGDGADEIYIANYITGDVYMIQDTDGDATSLLSSEIVVLGENLGAKFGAIAFDFDTSGTDEIYFGGSSVFGADIRVWDGEEFSSFQSDPGSDGFLPKMDVADMNGNGIPELITAHQMVSNYPQKIIRVLEYRPDDPSNSRWEFTPMANVGYTNDWGSSYAPVLGDYTGDGFIDVFVTNGGDQNNFLYQNSGLGYFNRDYNSDLAWDSNWSNTATWGDYDNDGALDLFVANGGDGEANCLYHNLGDGTFETMYNSSIASETGARGASWGDYDNDGYLDLYVANSSEANANNSLFHNNGDGSFSQIGVGWIVFDNDDSQTPTWCDYDNDGDLDMYVVNCGPNALYRNEGGGTFTKIQTGVLVADGYCSNGASWADYDNDGDFDVFVTSGDDHSNRLYQNQGGGVFVQITNGAIVTDNSNSWGSAWADLDNDGDLDLFVANSAEPDPRDNFIYINNGDGSFTGVYDNLLNQNDLLPIGCAWGDYNNDGDLDLFVAIDGGRNLLYSNQGNSNSWVNIQCVGTLSNQSAIGAKVRAKATILGNDVWQVQEISGQTGAFGQNSLNVEFGFADADIIDSLRIEWPSGMINEYTDIQVDEFYVIQEGPALQVSADTLAWGEVFLGSANSLAFELSNLGPESIQIDNVSIDNTAFMTDLTSFQIEPGSTSLLSVIFEPTETGNFEALLTFTSSDPLVPADSVVLAGQAILAPDINVTPDSVAVTLLPGATHTQIITIDNISGESPLYWTADLVTGDIDRTVTFTKDDYAPWEQPENQDRITDNVWITRSNSQGIFNAAVESGYDFDMSPWDTEWAYGYSEDLAPEHYAVWRDAINGQPPAMIDNPLSVHLISDDIYFDVIFHSWTSGGNGGGFSYTRTITSPEWIKLSADMGSLGIGESTSLELSLDAFDMPAGTHIADVVISSNDPDESEIIIPVELEVSVAPDIYLENDTLDFGNVYNGYSDTMAIQIENLGSADLVVSDVTADLTEFEVMTQNFEILALESYMLEVILTPSSAGDYVGELTLTTSDPDEEFFTITLLGSSLDPPIAGVAPDSLYAALLTDETLVQNMTISNTGLSELTYEIRSISIDNFSRERGAFPDVSLLSGSRYTWDELMGGNTQPSNFQGTMRGRNDKPGPRLAVENEMTDYALRNLRESWELLYTDPEEFGPVDVQHVYGSTTSDEVLVKIEGYSEFDEMVFVVYIDIDQNVNTGLDTEEDELGWYLGIDCAMISTGFGFDGFFLVDTESQEFILLDTLTTNIIETNSTERTMGAGISHFEGISAFDFAIICDSGIEDLVPDLGSGHITFPFSTPWLDFEPEIGTIAAGEQEDIIVTFDATDMYGGEYYSQITVLSNDPASPEVTASAHLTVTGIPDIDVELGVFDETSRINFHEYDASTTHEFATEMMPDGNGMLYVGLQGDFGSSSEYADVYIDGEFFMTVNPAVESYSVHEFTITLNSLNHYLRDGLMEVDVVNSSSVGSGDGNSFHEVHLRFQGGVDTLRLRDVFLGESRTSNIVIKNTGTDSLQISSISIGAGAFTLGAVPLGLSYDEADTVAVGFTPGAVGDYSATITITSDDPDEPLLTIPVLGSCVEPPVISVSHDSLQVVLADRQSLTRTITISNTGGSTLEYNAWIDLSDERDNYALHFDGAYDRVILGNDPALNPAGAMTISTWVKPESFSEWDRILVKPWTENSEPWQVYSLGLDDHIPARPMFVVTVNAQAFYLTSNLALTIGEWTHIAGTYDGEIMKIYVNGQFSGQSYDPSGPIDQFDTDVAVGYNVLHAPNSFNGEIDEVRIWNISRSQSQIQQDMYAKLSGSEWGLVGYWPFDEGYGSSTLDESGGGNPGYIYNEAQWTHPGSPVDLWIDLPVTQAVVNPGSMTGMDVRFQGIGLLTNDYTAEIVIAGNDPVTPEIRIPVEMHVDVVSVAEGLPLPEEFVLEQNYPNPFNPTTSIRYGLPEASDVSLVIYDLRGRVVQQYFAPEQAAGWANYEWSGTNRRGEPVSSGVYLCRLEAGNYTRTIKMVFLK
ncbi:MAG: VCBS repeat-containing protein [Candidatus Marinimicrobia bacterium]|nr:VCBS repeat-containing protein [Candidatus Neomarinimicrobiota bacterium]